jgi:hypothetical protein
MVTKEDEKKIKKGQDSPDGLNGTRLRQFASKPRPAAPEFAAACGWNRFSGPASGGCFHLILKISPG